MVIQVYLESSDSPVSFEADSWIVREDGILLIYKNIANPDKLPNARHAQVIGQFNKQAWRYVVHKDRVLDE